VLVDMTFVRAVEVTIMQIPSEHRLLAGRIEVRQRNNGDTFLMTIGINYHWRSLRRLLSTMAGTAGSMRRAGNVEAVGAGSAGAIRG
jgi:hypothetical protein